MISFFLCEGMRFCGVFYKTELKREREKGLNFVSFVSWENAQQNEGENFMLDARSEESSS